MKCNKFKWQQVDYFTDVSKTRKGEIMEIITFLLILSAHINLKEKFFFIFKYFVLKVVLPKLKWALVSRIKMTH